MYKWSIEHMLASCLIPLSRSNPIVELFNGHSKTEGVLNGENFTNESRFGAFPIQVHGHTHLHDSLDASTCAEELNQETWFTRLPPILVLELSRFQFNQASGQAEKVHDMLRFDKKMCLDRYLERNKEETRKRRVDVKRLREKLKALEGRLARLNILLKWRFYIAYNGYLLT